MHPWLRLIRWDRPTGKYLLFWPAMMTLCIAGNGAPDIRYIIIFTLGVFITSSAGCVINDWADRKIDGKVERTQSRPLVTGEVTPYAVWGIYSGLLAMAATLVIFTNTLTIVLAGMGAVWLSLYPFMKRVTHFPQIVLGIAYSWSVPMAFSAQTGMVPLSAAWIFAANFFWVVGFDMIYAMGDYAEDTKAGIKSIAQYFGAYSRMVVALLWVATALCFWKVGNVFHLGIGFFYGLGLAILHMGWQVWALREANAARCLEIFRSNAWLGAILGIAVEIGVYCR